MKYFVHIVAPCDDIFVGPFLAKHRANEHADAAGKRGYVTRILTATEYAANLLAFGPAVLQEPDNGL